MSSSAVSGETVRYQQTKNRQREETEKEEQEQQRTRRGGGDEMQVGSIQVSVGQPQWSGPEKGKDGGCKSCRSQAHHGCSPDPLHVWLPIASILLLPPPPLSLHGGLPHHRYRDRERWWERERRREGERERERERADPEDEVKQDRR